VGKAGEVGERVRGEKEEEKEEEEEEDRSTNRGRRIGQMEATRGKRRRGHSAKTITH